MKIPAVGESISSGTISVWHKKSGDFVKAGEPLFTLETDKVSTEITAEKDGVLTAHVPEGQEVKIGETVASIDESATAPEAPAPAKTDSDGAKQTKVEDPQERKSAAADVLSPAVRRIVEEEKIDPQQIKGSGKGGRLTKGDALAAAQNRGASDKPSRSGDLRVAGGQQGRSGGRRALHPQENVATAPEDRGPAGHGATHRRDPNDL